MDGPRSLEEEGRPIFAASLRRRAPAVIVAAGLLLALLAGPAARLLRPSARREAKADAAYSRLWKESNLELEPADALPGVDLAHLPSATTTTVPVAPLPGTGEAEAVIRQGVAVLQASRSEDYLSVQGALSTLGANVHTSSDWQGDQAHWNIQEVATGVYTLRNVNSGLYMSVTGGEVRKGANVHLWNNPDSDDTRWEIRSVEGGLCVLRNVKSSMYLNVAGGGRYVAPSVWIWDNPESDHSQWKILPQEEVLPWRRVTGKGVSASNDTSFAKAWDDDVSTYFDAADGFSYTAVELERPSQITMIRFRPRSGFRKRMVGGRFEAAVMSEMGPWDLLYTVMDRPRYRQFTPVLVNSTNYYTWVRYVGPKDGHSNIADIRLHGVIKPSRTESAPAPVESESGSTGTRAVDLGGSEGSAAGAGIAAAGATGAAVALGAAGATEASSAAGASGSSSSSALPFPTFSFPTLTHDQWMLLNYCLLGIFLVTCLSAAAFALLCFPKKRRPKVVGRIEVFGNEPVPQPVALPPQPMTYSQIPSTVPIMAPQHTLPPADPVDRYSQGFIDAVAATSPNRQRPHGLAPSAMWVPLKQNN